MRYFVLFGFLFCFAWNHDSTAQEIQPDVVASIERLVGDLQRESAAPGISVAIGIDNDVRYAKGFGFADLENNVSVTPETKFRTASIAKSMTATLVLSLYEEGKIELDADVRQYEPAYPEKRWPVTTRQLLGHLGGVRHYKSSAETVSTQYFESLDDALRVFADDPLLHEPGSKYRYTTFGYNLLGNVAEGAGGDSFWDLLKAHVLVPANMRDTVVDDQSAIVPNRVRGYARAQRSRQETQPESTPPIRNASLHDTSMKIPGGGLLSTPSDLIRFASAIQSGKLLEEATREMMWTRQTTTGGDKTAYGLGWGIGYSGGHKIVSHTGGQAGTSTVVALCPDSGISVAIMCNLQSVSLKPLANQIIALVREASLAARYQDAIRKLNRVVQAECAQKSLPAFSIAMVEGNSTIWSMGEGYLDSEGEVAASGSTVYRVGSISKLFTDLAVMQLVEQGVLDLDAPVQTYLPTFRPDDREITLRQLMTHRSGLVRESPVGNYFDPSEPGLDATVSSLNETALVYPPGERTKYSNAGVSVVGAILESVLDVSHPTYVREQLLNPLKMSDSGFEMTAALQGKLAAASMWTYDGRRFEAPGFLLGTGPAGNLYASVNDLAQFISCVLNDGEYGESQVISSETLDSMLSPANQKTRQARSFGIGFHLSELDGHRKIGHGGAIYGYSTQLAILPDDNIGVVAASALDGSNGVVARITDYALRLMLAARAGKPLPDYSLTAPIPAQRASQLVGTYLHEGDGSFIRVSRLGEKTWLQRGTFRSELRWNEQAGTLVCDDVLGYGPEIDAVTANEVVIDGKTYVREVDAAPPAVEPRWKPFLGEYGWDHNVLYILEDHGQLYALIEWFYYYPLTELEPGTFAFPDYGLYHGEKLIFETDDSGTVDAVVAASVRFERREVGTADGETFKITPVKPIRELRAAALSATPPDEAGSFRSADLVELTSLDSEIHLDIRYASENNFTGAIFYQQPKAFMQRPAAMAVVQANQSLRSEGLGLLVHDAYRPWHVTKMFWDATPNQFKDFVVNPANGSRHNRGCAVDITLYDRASGEPIQMVAGYDEFSERSFPLYPGGTARQRWYRDLLRRTMEQVGFTVYEFEWWHFDFADWREYRIGNQTFEELLSE